MKAMVKHCVTLAAAGILAACSADDVKQPQSGDATVSAKILFAGQMCQTQSAEMAQPEIHWVRTVADWRQWQSDSPRQIIALDNSPDRETRPQVDFGQQRVVVVGLGQKPTGGYSVSLIDPGVVLKDDVLQVHVEVQQPAADAMVTQVITSPCVALQLPILEVSTLQAIDQQGNVLVQSQVPSP